MSPARLDGETLRSGPSSAARAAATARSTSSGPAWATSQIGSPVAGSIVAKVRPSAASARSPPISRRCGALSTNSRADSDSSCAAVAVGMARSYVSGWDNPAPVIRFLSFLSIACLATAVIILLTSADSDAPIAIVLLLLAFGITTLLGIRRGYHKVRGIVDDARRFVSGDIQEARLVEVGDPSGLFNPESTMCLELEGEDGTCHGFERDVPIPFPVAWS